MTRIIILATPNTLSQQLAEIQKLGICPSGPPIIPAITSEKSWDARCRDYPDYLEGKS